MQRVGDRAGAVVARVLPLPVAAAVLVRAARDPVARGDDAADADRQPARAARRAAVGALEDGGDARVPERPPGGRADDAVGGQAVAALEGLDGALRAGAEDPVDRDPEAALEQPDAAALARAAADAAGAARAAAVRGAPQRGPRRGADDAVGGEAVAALEGLDRALGALAEDAVRVDAQPALGLLHARALGALLERLRRRVGRGGGEHGGRARDAGGGQQQRKRKVERQRSQKSVRSFVWRPSCAYEVS